MDLFLEDLDYGVHSLELISEIFRDNEILLTYKITPLIRKITNYIDSLDIETTKKATLISFLDVFNFFKEKALEENQYILLCEISSTTRKNMNYLFTNED